MTNAHPPLFPIQLLGTATENRVQYFRDCLIEHANQQECLARAMSAINSACGPRIVQVVGPTGAGKSTLAGKIYQALLEQYRDLIDKDPGAVPVAILDAIAPNGSSFNWKDFYIRLLEKHGDILTNRKMLVPRQHDLFEGLSVSIRVKSATASRDKTANHSRTKTASVSYPQTATQSHGKTAIMLMQQEWGLTASPVVGVSLSRRGAAH